MRSKKYLFLLGVLINFNIVYADTIRYVSCGDKTGLPYGLPDLTRTVIWIIQIGVPILLILFGSVDMVKAVFSTDDKDFAKPIKKLVTRSIAAVLVFFVFLFVKLILKETSYYTNTMMECVTCFTTDGNYCYEYEVEKKNYDSEKEASEKAREELASRREEARKENAKKAEEERKKKEEENKKNNNNNNNNSNNNGDNKLVGAKYAEQAFNYLVSKGWSKQAAAGAIGNMYQETNYGGDDIDPWASDKYGNGGIVGWTDNGEATNMTQFKNYASSVNDPWPNTSLKTQLDFLVIHASKYWTGAYNTPTYNGLNQHGYYVSHISFSDFIRGTNVRDAALQFLAFYEDCGYEYSNVDYRIKMAEAVYNSYA